MLLQLQNDMSVPESNFRYSMYIFNKTCRLGRSTVSLFLAYSYNFLPFTLTEEYIGGIC